MAEVTVMTRKDDVLTPAQVAGGVSALAEKTEEPLVATEENDDTTDTTPEEQLKILTPDTVTTPNPDTACTSITNTVTDAKGSEIASSAATNSMNTTVFPCIEQPIRVTLHCNGYYLWGLRNGRVIARKQRSEKDEFRLDYDNEEGNVIIHNHKFGSTLSVLANEKDGTNKLVCVKEREKDESEETVKTEEIQNNTSETNVNDDSTPKSVAPTSSNPASDACEDDENCDETSISEKDKKWHFIKCADGHNRVMLKSIRTGENVAITTNGELIFATDERADDPSINMTWDIECVTGELCFISNPTIDLRLRCDMAGLLSLTEAWKGWEVFRFMEAGHGYVKVSSWMHSQWLLCSTEDGKVTTCSHAESLLEDNPKGCCKWAIEKSPEGLGVIIRSKTFGRLLSVDNGQLKTYIDGDENSNELASKSLVSKQTSQQNDSASGSTSKSVGRWWKSSVTSMNSSMRNMPNRLNWSSIKSLKGGSAATDAGEELTVPQKYTTVWQIESAHSQTYYFTSIIEGEKPKTIGPFLHVTPNLRKTDKIQLIRLTHATKLYNTEKKQFIACSADGEISFVDDAQNESTEWIMEKSSIQEGGSIFRSKVNNCYLSYEDLNKAENETETQEGRFNSLFNTKAEKMAKLVSSESLGEREVWRLEPCMPRAVSSEKITTFAIGTGIAVGTTIAMPFALAGASVALGAIGAHAGVMFNAVAVTLSGAEALASVGAIGATAYIVFRPAENSLTDDHAEEEKEAERAWSKRPFSNWRNW